MSFAPECKGTFSDRHMLRSVYETFPGTSLSGTSACITGNGSLEENGALDKATLVMTIYSVLN